MSIYLIQIFPSCSHYNFFFIFVVDQYIFSSLVVHKLSPLLSQNSQQPLPYESFLSDSR